MKVGDHVIWLHSRGRSFLSGWRVQQIPGVIVQISRSRIRIRIVLDGSKKEVNVDPDNVIRSCEDS